jgi:propanol-preferring alcohol dehydrogenase
MRAMVLDHVPGALRAIERPVPVPGERQVLISVHACGVCRTDLHVVDGELPDLHPPIIPGHEIVGTVVACGPKAERFAIGDRVGVPWLGWTCGDCAFCRSGRENLCDHARFTGYQIDGGYAELTVAGERFCCAIPPQYGDVEAAPLLCAGLIGYRALRFAGDAERIGLYGFGAAAHIVAQVAKFEGRRIFAFTRKDDARAQEFARGLGVDWAGASDERPPVELEAALIFAPVGSLVRNALQAVEKGGSVICAGIHMSDIPSIPYRELWGERVVRSVANLTSRDAEEFMAVAARTPIRVSTHARPLIEANEALAALRAGDVTGAEVLVP